MKPTPINSTCPPPSLSEAAQPVLRAQVFSDESSLQGCGSVSSCFNWIYSLLASMWNALFGAAAPEKPAFDEKLWERLSKHPQELAKELVGKPDFQDAYVGLFDQFARLDANLNLCEEMQRFTHECSAAMGHSQPPTPSLPYQMRFNMFAGREYFIITPEAAPHLLAIAKDHPFDLIFKFLHAQDLLLQAIPPNETKLSQYQKEANALAQSMNDSSRLDDLARALSRYVAMSILCKKPFTLPPLNSGPVLDQLAAKLLVLGQYDLEGVLFDHILDLRVKFYSASGVNPLSACMEKQALLLKEQPNPGQIKHLGPFFSRTAKCDGELLYDHTATDLYSAFARLINALKPDAPQKNASDMCKAIAEHLNRNTSHVLISEIEDWANSGLGYRDYKEYLHLMSSGSSQIPARKEIEGKLLIEIFGLQVTFYSMYYSETGGMGGPSSTAKASPAYIVGLKPEQKGSKSFGFEFDQLPDRFFAPFIVKKAPEKR